MAGDEPGAKPVPAAFSCCDQMYAAAEEPPSFCFQTRYAVPVFGSTKGCGSIDPVAWQSRGALDTSLNCTWIGEIDDAVATARQSKPVSELWPACAAS